MKTHLSFLSLLPLLAVSCGEHDHDGLRKRYPKTVVADFDGKPGELTEMDALIAYLQILGRMVDFKKYTVKDLQQ